MPIAQLSIDPQLAGQVPEPIRAGLARLRTELDVPESFPPEVEQAAARAAADGPLTVPGQDARVDRTDLPFVTLDPPGSMDLDQAMHLERTADGYRVWYAIADVAAWVEPGGPVDVEAHRRGQTFYAPIERAPLHPSVLSEGAASLLADGKDRPALVWRVELDPAGAQLSATVERATVRSRARLDYPGVQRQLDDGTADEVMQLLREVGTLRRQQEVARGGVSLDLPEQEVVTEGDGWRTRFRTPLPVEGWNAQISLLVGMAAARMMVERKVGIVRTLPPADERALARLRATAQSLGIAWPQGMGYPDFVRSLEVTQPRHLAMMTACTRLFRGAGYTVVDEQSAGSDLGHHALAADYAHCTAPLRRLVDRYAGEVCVHLCAGTPVPQWVLDAMPALPQEMQDSDHRARKFERGVLDLVEALVLSTRVGQEFDATVVEADEKQASISIADPAVESTMKVGGLRLGQQLRVRLEGVDLAAGSVRFVPVAA